MGFWWRYEDHPETILSLQRWIFLVDLVHARSKEIIVHVPLQSGPYQFQLSEFAQPQTLNKAIFYGKFTKNHHLPIRNPNIWPWRRGGRICASRAWWNAMEPGHPHATDLSNWYNQYKIKGVPSSLPLMMIRYPAIRQGVRPKISHTMLILKGLVICCCSLNENCHESCPPNRIEIYKKIQNQQRQGWITWISIGKKDFAYDQFPDSSRLPLLHPQHRHIRLLLAQPPELENKPAILGCGLQPIDGNIGHSSFLGLPRCMSVSVSSVPQKTRRKYSPTHQPSLTIHQKMAPSAWFSAGNNCGSQTDPPRCRWNAWRSRGTWAAAGIQPAPWRAWDGKCLPWVWLGSIATWLPASLQEYDSYDVKIQLGQLPKMFFQTLWSGNTMQHLHESA